MSVAAQLEDIMHQQLKVHAAWLPITSPYNLGDYGLIADGVFQKIGNVKDDFNLTFNEQAGQDAELNFVSASTTLIDAKTGAEIGLNPQIEIKAGVTFRFNKERSIMIKAPVINVTVISNVNQLAKALRKLPSSDWKNRFKVVFQVYKATNPLIISTIDAGTEITFSGEGNLPEQFNVGQADVSFSLKTNKKLGLEVKGKCGIIALGLFKLKLLGGVNVLAADEAEEKPAENLNGQKLSDDL